MISACAGPWSPALMDVPCPELPPGEVHAWWIALDADPDAKTASRATLSRDERERADRFRKPHLGRRFASGRAALRGVLARYAGKPAADLRFVYGPHGKPSLAPDSGVAGLRFNLSHSEGVGVVAVASGCEVGVDVERIRADLSPREIAARFFSPSEVESLNAVPQTELASAFYACWTRKEAFVKACGGGLAIPLDGFSVCLDRDAPPEMRGGDSDGFAARWSIRGLSCPPSHVAAIAFDRPEGRVRIGRWPSRESVA